MVKFKDISLFFKSECCSNNGRSNSCQTATKKLQPYEFFKHLGNTKNALHATTITIGRKWIGRMSVEDQYEVFVKRIKKHIPYHSEKKYVYEFEIQKNGQLHAHGLEYNTYQNNFVESFCDFGSRNNHPKAFQEVKHLDEYIKYITKEKAFPTIHNIKKKDLCSIKKDPSEAQLIN